LTFPLSLRMPKLYVAGAGCALLARLLLESVIVRCVGASVGNARRQQGRAGSVSACLFSLVDRGSID